MTQRIFLAINAILGAVCLVSGLICLSGKSASRDGAWILFLLACCFISSAIGHYTGKRFFAVLAAIPMICMALFYIFILLIGGWAWGPSNESTVNMLILGGTLVIAFEIANIIITKNRKINDPGKEDNL